MAHVTGGGLLDNLPRMLPADLSAELDPGSWPVPPIFDHLTALGDLSPDDRCRAFNMGVGFAVAMDPSDAPALLAAVDGSTVVGRVVPTPAGGERVIGRV